MTQVAEEFYRSANGDVWSLVHDREGGRRFVRHVANTASGGHVTELAVGEFLAINGSGPEFAALRCLFDV